MFLNGRVLRASLIVSVLALATLLLCVSADAYTRETTLTGTLGTLRLIADASKVGSEWLYSYELYYQTGSVELYTFSVGNPMQVAYTNAENTDDFTNPGYNPIWEEVKWWDGWMEVGDTVTFSYKSYNMPNLDIDVDCYAQDGGKIAWGKTIGMSELIPEPSTFAGVAIAILGLAPTLLRKRR